ncbi:MAG: ribosome maturation factor RimP [Acidobacteria bacterium]|nr:MAG: ribosome maturation factor RimP [Acidobacteriota bacterium]
MVSETERIETAVEALAERVAQGLGLAVYDLRFRQAGPRWKLQVFIERAGEAPATLDDCERLSRQLSHELDADDPIPHAYDLEVSTPGIERALRRRRHWERALGRRVRVRWRDETGKVRTEVLTVRALNGDSAALTGGNGEELVVPLSRVLSARLHIDW